MSFLAEIYPSVIVRICRALLLAVNGAWLLWLALMAIYAFIYLMFGFVIWLLAHIAVMAGAHHLWRTERFLAANALLTLLFGLNTIILFQL